MSGAKIVNWTFARPASFWKLGALWIAAASAGVL